MHTKVLEKTEEMIEKVIEQGIDAGNNLEVLDKLVDIHKDIKEEICMNNSYGRYEGYGNYGRGYSEGYGNYGAGSYGEYGRERYGRRGVDSKYRGDEYMDRMAGDYGRYMDSRERYGAGEDTDKAHYFMIKSLEDFIKFLYEDAQSPQQKQKISEALQRSMM